MFRFVIGLIVFFIVSSTVFSQQRSRANMSNICSISGKIIESEEGTAMSYVNVMVYNVKNDSLISGAISDKSGKFTVEKLPFGDYYILIKMIGYEKKKVNSIILSNQKKNFDLGTIKLDLKSLMSEGVEVIAEKPLMEYKMDKKVINVSRDITSQSGSAVTVLENSPAVQVDIEGNVTLRGSSNFTVFINNKPSVLQGSDALEQIPASSIESIELITNPSAKYDPDGIGGIINVVMKKESLSGLTGMIDLSAGTGDKYSANLLLNYKVNDFTFFTGLNYRDNKRSASGISEDIFYYEDPVKHIDADTEGSRKHKSQSIKAGIGYDFTPNSSLLVQGSIGSFGFGRIHNNNRFQWYEEQVNLDSFFVNENEMSRERDFYSINADYTYKFDSPGHMLTSSFSFSNDNGGGDNKQIDYNADKDWNQTSFSTYNIWSDETEVEDEYRFKTDYTLPLGENSTFEAGIQSRVDREREEYQLRNLDTLSNWIVNPQFENAMDFSRDIHSIYSTYSNKIGNTGFNVGLRGEYTLRTIGVEKENKDYTIDRFDFFPTVHLSHDFGNDHQMMLSYSRRIDRPRGWDLEPSIMYMDANSYRVGDPSLEPEYINSIELGYQKYFGMSFVSVESFFRETNNKITRIKEIRDEFIYNTITNLDKDYSVGVELIGNYEPAKFLRFNVSSSLYHYYLDGEVFGEDISKSTTTWDARLMATYMLNSLGTKFQLNGSYRGPSVYAQGTRGERYSVNLAIRQDFLNNQASLTLQVRDIFGTMKREYTTDTPLLYTYDLREMESQVVSLSFSYRINNFKPEKKSGDSMNGDMDDEM